MANSKLGVNAGEQNYYSQNTLTIDLMKGSSPWQNGNFPTQAECDAYLAGRANGDDQDWLPNLPAGRSVYAIVKQKPYTQAPSPPVSETFDAPLKAGKYVMTWTGPATCVFSQLPAGISNVVVNANRCEVTFPTAEIRNMSASVTNGTGAAITVNDVKVFHIDDEAALNAGKLFRPEHLQKYKGVSNVRMLDLIKPMWWWITDPATAGGLRAPLNTSLTSANLRTLTSRRWEYWPAAALGKLAMEVSEVNGNKPIDLWITVPVRMTNSAVSTFFQQLYATHTTGKVHVEAGNEIWNNGYPFGFQQTWYHQAYLNGEEQDGNGVQRTLYNGAGNLIPGPYTRTGTLGSYVWKDANNVTIESYNSFPSLNAHQAVDFWLAAEAVYGRSRVVRVLASHNFNDGYSVAALNTVTTKLGASGKIGLKLDVLATGSYLYMGVSNGSGGTNAVRTDDLMATKFHLNSTAQQDYFNLIKYWIDNRLAPSNIGNKGLLTTMSSPAVLKFYECWRHTNTMIMTEGFGALVVFNIDTADNTLSVDVTTGATNSLRTRDEMFDTGDVLRITSSSPFPVTSPVYLEDYFTQYNTIRYISKQVFVRRFSTNKLTLHPTLTDATNNTNVITLNAIPTQTGTTLVAKGTNITRLAALENMQRTFARSELGRQMFIYWWNKCVKGIADEANLYTAVGSGWNDGFGSTWGLIESDVVADHPVAVQARKMNNIGENCAQLLT